MLCGRRTAGVPSAAHEGGVARQSSNLPPVPTLALPTLTITAFPLAALPAAAAVGLGLVAAILEILPVIYVGRAADLG